MSTKIVALLGPAGAGKSTIAVHLVEHYGATLYAIAAPLKAIAMQTLGLSHAQCYGTQEQKEAFDGRFGMSARTLLQRLGDAMRAELGADVFVDAVLAQIERERPSVAVIEDARRHNEVCAIAGRKRWDPSDAGGVLPVTDGANNGWRNLLPNPAAINMAEILTGPRPTLEGYVWKLYPPHDAQAELRALAAGDHPTETEWRTAETPYTIAPVDRGVGELLELADNMAAVCGLAKITKKGSDQ